MWSLDLDGIESGQESSFASGREMLGFGSSWQFSGEKHHLECLLQRRRRSRVCMAVVTV